MPRLPDLNERQTQSRSRSPRREEPLDPLPEDTEELLRDPVMWPGSIEIALYLIMWLLVINDSAQVGALR